MKICKKEQKPVELVMGNLYEHKGGDIYICAYEERLISLKCGGGWADNGGFEGKDHLFTNVTDKYCLMEIDNREEE